MNEKLTPRIFLKRNIFLILAIISLILFGLSLISHQINLNKEFNSELWKDKSTSLAVDNDLITLRQRMTNDLVKNILPGLTRIEVISLLGRPDDSGVEVDWVLLYRLGSAEAIGIDKMCLIIRFDGKDEFFQGYEAYNHCG